MLNRGSFNTAALTTPRGSRPRPHVEDGLHVGCAVAGKALVRPAQRVRRDDHVVESQKPLVSRRRLDFEYVQPCAGDPAVLQGLGQRAWSTIGPRAVLIR